MNRPVSLDARRRRLFGFMTPALLAALALTTTGRPASAQSDLSPPLPNVMLLVDTSGSMEYMTGSTSFPTCDPTTNGTSTKSRWIDLVEVLTGSITNYRCEAIDRKTTTYRDGEYGTTGPLATAPYDYLYDNPYHRPLSGTCAVGPGPLPTNVWQWLDTSLRQHPYNSTGGTCATAFAQAQDGILDAFQYSVRFGLMTFDSHADPSTGFSGTSTRQSAQGVLGTWSYIFGATTTGKPMSCLTAAPAFEVGARNAAAPPWEGRMIPFGDPSTGSTEYLSKKAQIEQVLLATRPYGPTPIAGLLKDASDFLTLDNTKDPLVPANDFGPYNDPYVKDSYGSCRERRIILLSDGQPNMDLRPDCSDSSATEPNCPFKKPEQIALALKSLNPPIETSVIAFALPQFNVVGRGTVTCNDLTDSDFDSAQPSGLCQSQSAADLANAPLQACCTLNKIAVAGGSGTKPRAWFANDRESLSKALSAVLSDLAPVTTRSPPTVGGAAGGSQGFRFFPSAAPVKEQPWTGDLQRQRFTCENGVAKALNIDVNSQDDFASNINLNPADRYFSSIQASGASGRSVRPYYAAQVATPDGLGSDGGTRYAAKRDAWVAATTPAMIEINASTCTNPGLTDLALCRDRYLKWLVGLDNNTQYSRCTESGQCYLMGDILRSTPRVVGAPRDFVRDETYDTFVKNQALRPVVVYTATNDGFLHAFKVAANDPTDTDKVLGPGAKNNELWAFVPPAVLPHLRKQYPGTHQALLDGVPVVKDVVATINSDANQIRLQRSRSDAQTATGSWRTILLSSLGSQNPAGGGYFALDITNPVLNTSSLTSNNAGPRFLWQLTKDSGDRPLFGRGAEPVITTVFVALDGQPPMQVPVAILPGGQGNQGTLLPSGTGCPSTARSYSGVTEARFTIRGKVNCYAAADLPGRSLTIVRLDNGRVLRTFRQSNSEIVDANLKALVSNASSPSVDIDSPISGRPVAFPSQTGAIADRAFVGDQDGKLWKVDLSSTNPMLWTMKVFFDAYAKDANNSSSTPPGPGDGQPIVLPPVLSVDENGDVTVVVATGDQETVGASNTIVNYVWSLTEKTTNNRSSTYTKVNWYLPLTGGERVVGPMSLFNGQLFFTTVSPVPPSVLSSHPCALDTGKVWGMDYIVPKETTDISKGGVGRLPLAAQPDQQYLTAQQVTGSSNAAMFGVAVAQVPSCATIGDSIANDFMGYKAEQAIRTMTPGEYQLVMTYRDGTTPANNLKVNVATVKLKPPPSSARIDSWAALFE